MPFSKIKMKNGTNFLRRKIEIYKTRNFARMFKCTAQTDDAKRPNGKRRCGALALQNPLAQLGRSTLFHS